MDYIQKASAFYGKQITDINTNPESMIVEEILQKLTVRDVVAMLAMFPENFKDLTFGEVQDMILDPSKGEPVLEEMFSSMTEEQNNAFTELLGKYFPDV